MKHILLMMAAVMALCESASAQKAELTAKEVTERLQRRYEMIDDATVEFKQNVKLGFSDIEQSFQGTFQTSKPNKYRIETDHQTIVTDGVTVWAYSPMNKQVIIDRYKENQNSVSPEQFLLNLPANFYVAILGLEKVKGSAPSVLVLKLTPKDDRSFVRSMKAWVEEDSWTVRKVVTIDVNDTETTYLITGQKLNSGLKEKNFTFSAPEGTEVVDLR